MKTITSRQNPVVRAFRDLAARPDPTGTRLLLDGAHLIQDALNAGIEFELACVAASRQEQPTEERTLATAMASRGVEVIAVSDQVFAAISPVRTPSGIVAIGQRQPTMIADLCARTSPLLVVGVDLQDPGNVGAVIRVAEAAGTTGVFVTGASANPFSWKALRGSMGSALRLPVVHTVALAQVQASLLRSDVRTVAAVPRGGVAPEAIHWDGGIAIVVGGEGPGLSDEVVAACDERVTIPMAAQVESLNVAVAAALLLYVARRHRNTSAESHARL
jgi:TrmH family RNA methyltransferase